MLALRHENALKKSPSTLVVFLELREKSIVALAHDDWKKEIDAAVLAGDLEAKESGVASVRGAHGFEKSLLAVLPAVKGPYPGESVRRLGASLAGWLEKRPEAQFDLTRLADVAKAAGLPPKDFVVALAEGLALKNYRFDRYKQKKDDDKPRFSTALFAGADPHVAEGLAVAKANAECAVFARDLVNEPGNVLTADELAKRTVKEAKKLGVKAVVFDEKKIRALKMGGLLAVNAGSENPPRFISLEYRNPKAKKHVLLVGKGVTFDTGGISIKPAAGMGEMKGDMAGAAAVIGAIFAAARRKLPVNVTVVVPATDNKPDGKAQNPGDVITMRSGLTVEVDNTDAEGRLILGDALHYGIEKYAPDVTIDLATLTGACVVALGQWTAAMYATEDEWGAKLFAAGQRSYERVWNMPLHEEYADQIKSHVADLKNTGGRSGGSVTAAKFLQRFTDGKPWIHLDIAGTALIDAPTTYLPKEGTGFGVRLLVEFLANV